jgi:hypothetical protein
MTPRTVNLKLLVNAQLEELSERLTNEGIDHDADYVRSVAKYLEEI